MTKEVEAIVKLMKAGKITGFKFKEVKHVYHFADGKTDTATFCLGIDHDDPANPEIYSAMAEYAERIFALGNVVKVVTTARFI